MDNNTADIWGWRFVPVLPVIQGFPLVTSDSPKTWQVLIVCDCALKLLLCWSRY